MNPFESLCQLATKERWCWNIYCTTCGHLHFKYAFRELGKGKSPEEVGWIVRASQTKYEKQLGEIPRIYSDTEKIQIVTICKEADLKLIRTKCTFPDWLGYLGLVLYHFQSQDQLFRTLSVNWAKQFLDMLPSNDSAYLQLSEIPKNDKMLLSVNDLSNIEKVLI